MTLKKDLAVAQVSFPNELLFEDDHLVCVYQPGTRTDHFVVTFSEMMMRPNSNAIWSGNPIRKLGYPAIGYVGKSQNWFPRSSIQMTLPEVRRRVMGFDEVTGYGFSMGAWATLYYADDIGLTTCLAFSPQYSIDPEDLVDRRFVQHFDAALNSGMKLTRGAGSSFNLVVADPFNAGDWVHVSKITEFMDCNVIPIRSTGHGSVRAIAGTEVLEGILVAIKKRDVAHIRSIVAKARRSYTNRPVQLIFALRKKHPVRAFAIYSKYSQTLSVSQRIECLTFLAGSDVSNECAVELWQIEQENGPSPEISFALALHHLARGEKAAALERIAYTRAHRSVAMDGVIETRIERMPDP